MKVFISGATGFIGGHVLRRLLALPSITSIVALSRRKLDISDPKIQVLILKDFLQYDEDTLAQLQGAEACIWCLGKPTSGKEVPVDYTMAAANALLGELGDARKMTFVYLSGSLVEHDQDKALWFLGGAREMRGELENKVLAIQTQHPRQWQSFVARPAYVTVGEPMLRLAMFGHYIPVEELAAALVDTAMNRSEMKRLENADLRRRGQAALTETS